MIVIRKMRSLTLKDIQIQTERKKTDIYVYFNDASGNNYY